MKSNAVELFEDEFNSDERKIACRPFIKWVGGKTQLLDQLQARIPLSFKRYFEPFLGGGALLFKIQPQNAIVADLNPELINAYQIVKSDVEALIVELKRHRYEKEYFYKVRNVDRTPEYESWTPVQRAARLIFLNKTCYNGLYRVNSKGHFNTPFGRYSQPTIVDEPNLRACGQALRNVDIGRSDFRTIENLVKKGDFVYFDPPYLPLSATSNFTTYNSDGFGQQMQIKLYELCSSIDQLGVNFMLSNSAAPFISDLYKNFRIETVTAIRAVNSKAAKRGKIEELVIRNY